MEYGEFLTGEENARRAKHEEWRRLAQASLVGASKHWVVSFPVAARPFVGEADGPQISAWNLLP